VVGFHRKDDEDRQNIADVDVGRNLTELKALSLVIFPSYMAEYSTR
jgi:hypothetical protein